MNKHLNVILNVGMTAVNLNVIECLVALTRQETCKSSGNSNSLMKELSCWVLGITRNSLCSALTHSIFRLMCAYFETGDNALTNLNFLFTF
jgi:hypothetical protein